MTHSSRLAKKCTSTPPISLSHPAPTSLLRIRRARTPDAATDQVTPTAAPRAIIVWVSVRGAGAGREECRYGAPRGLGAVAGRVEADGAGALGGAGGAVVVVEGDVAAGDDARGGTAAGADNLEG